MRRRMTTGAWLVLGFVLVLTVPGAGVSAQGNPDVNILCDPVQLTLASGADEDRNSTSFCDASNPTMYTEVVSLAVISDIHYEAPASIRLGPGASEAFEILFTADVLEDPGEYSATLRYEVQTANGMANPNPQTKEVSMVLQVQPPPGDAPEIAEQHMGAAPRILAGLVVAGVGLVSSVSLVLAIRSEPDT